MLLLVPPHALLTSVGHFAKFREPDAALAAEWAAFRAGQDSLGNDALAHQLAANAFCNRRKAGCSWAQHHAPVQREVRTRACPSEDRRRTFVRSNAMTRAEARAAVQEGRHGN